MAWIRMELQAGGTGAKQRWDGICENTSDLGAEIAATNASFEGAQIKMAPGSLAYCVEDGKLYVKTASLTWAEVS